MVKYVKIISILSMFIFFGIMFLKSRAPILAEIVIGGLSFLFIIIVIPAIFYFVNKLTKDNSYDGRLN